MNVTVQQIRELWNDRNPDATIDRGDDYQAVTKDDLGALANEIDTDDAGYPIDDDEWQTLADQLNSETPGAPTDTKGQVLLQKINLQRTQCDRIHADAKHADNELASTIRAAIENEVPVTGIAAAARLSRERIYQIRDNRR